MLRRPDYPMVSEFRDRHKGDKIVVLGLGESVTDEALSRARCHVTIGSNDIARVFTPTYLVTIDSPQGLDKDHSPGERSVYVKTALDRGSTLVLVQPPRWESVIPDFAENPNVWQMAADRPWSWKDPRFTNELPDYKRYFSGRGMARGPMMPKWCCTPHLAVHFAAFMGAKHIGMIGVDLSENRFFEKTDREHGLSDKVFEINKVFGNTLDRLREDLGVSLWNLSGISQVTSVPFIGWKEFEELNG